MYFAANLSHQRLATTVSNPAVRWELPDVAAAVALCKSVIFRDYPDSHMGMTAGLRAHIQYKQRQIADYPQDLQSKAVFFR